MENQNQNKNKSHFRFDEWEEITSVDCNDCKRYYDETCDGAPQGPQRLCKAFLATRRVDLPEQIKSCQNGLKSLTDDVVTLRFAVAIEFIIIITYIIANTLI